MGYTQVSTPPSWVSWWMGVSTVIVLWGESLGTVVSDGMPDENKMLVTASLDRGACRVGTSLGFGGRISGSASFSAFFSPILMPN